MADFYGYTIYEDGSIIGLNSKPLKLETTKNGYKRFSFKINGENKRYLIHRLMMKIFVGESDLDVNHKNGIKTDNRIENLEYVTRKENIRHAWQNGLAKKRTGDNMHTSKIKDSDIEFIRKNKGLISAKNLAEMFNVNRGSIYRIQNNKSRNAA